MMYNQDCFPCGCSCGTHFGLCCGWIGVTGPRGATGPRGTTGATGATGPTGATEQVQLGKKKKTVKRHSVKRQPAASKRAAGFYGINIVVQI